MGKIWRSNRWSVQGSLGVRAGGFLVARVRGSLGEKFEVIGFTRPQLQHAFKHAGDFGVVGNPSNTTLAEFSSAMHNHVTAPGTRAMQGTYRGEPVTHCVD